jgi:Ca2+-binding RTX toxin-like protein
VKGLSIGALSLVLVAMFAPASVAQDGPASEAAPAPRSWVSSGLLIFYSGTVDLALADPGEVSSDLVVSGQGAVVDLDVTVGVFHTYVGNLAVILTHVDTGTAVTIIDRPGYIDSGSGCDQDDIFATLDDEASTPVEGQCLIQLPSIFGDFSPNNPLSAFDGEDLGGTWRLTVVDHETGESGSLDQWGLRFRVMECNAVIATIVGTGGNDHLIGTSGPDVIVGLGGADIIEARGGDDLVCAGAGKDTVMGGSGDDVLYGQGGNDTLIGGAGADWLFGLKGHDTLSGGADDDHILGEGGRDTADYSTAGAAVVVDLGVTITSGGAGNDILQGIEKVIGSAFDDTIIGSLGAEVLRGGAGDDLLVGHAGADRLYGQAGDDILRGNAGHDLLHGGPGNDTANGGAGTDTCAAETEVACE